MPLCLFFNCAHRVIISRRVNGRESGHSRAELENTTMAKTHWSSLYPVDTLNTCHIVHSQYIYLRFCDGDGFGLEVRPVLESLAMGNTQSGEHMHMHTYTNKGM